MNQNIIAATLNGWQPEKWIQGGGMMEAVGVGSVLLGMVGATFIAMVSYQLLPYVFESLSAPISRRSITSSGVQDEESKLAISLLKLYASYLLGSVIFLVTGGALGQLSQYGKAANAAPSLVAAPPPVNVNLFAVATGIVIVAMVRMECVRQTCDLYNTLLQLSVAALASIAFALVADPRLIGWLSDFATGLDRSVGIVLVFGSALVGAFVEGVFICLHYAGNHKVRSVPFSLVRARIESSEHAEQIWEPWRVGPETTRMIKHVIGRLDGPIEVQWLTSTVPQEQLDAFFEGAHMWASFRQMSKEDAEKLLKQTLKVLIPDNHGNLSQIRKHPLCDCVRTYSADARPRLRMLALNRRVAIFHMPVGFHDLGLDESSNYAAITYDPHRINNLRTSFDRLWESATPVAGATAAAGSR